MTPTPRPINALDVQVGDRIRLSPVGRVITVAKTRINYAGGGHPKSVTVYGQGDMGRTVLWVYPE